MSIKNINGITELLNRTNNIPFSNMNKTSLDLLYSIYKKIQKQGDVMSIERVPENHVKITSVFQLSNFQNLQSHYIAPTIIKTIKNRACDEFLYIHNFNKYILQVHFIILDTKSYSRDIYNLPIMMNKIILLFGLLNNYISVDCDKVLKP